MPKDIRFGELVKRFGRPQMVSLWTDPKHDRSFMKAVKENRVLTLIQEPASKRKDFGRIGFHQEPHASYLVFPKSLPEEKPRVIGIKYELVEQPSVSDPVKLTATAPRKAARKTTPRHKTFQVLFRRWATIETPVTIKTAANAAEAKRLAMREVAAQAFDLTKAIMRNEVTSVEELQRAD